MRVLFLKILYLFVIVVVTSFGGTVTSHASPETEKSEASINFDELADSLAKGKKAAPILEKLGKPTAVMPGRDKDIIYHYTFSISDKKQLLLVIIVDDSGKVFRHQFYEKDCNVALC